MTKKIYLQNIDNYVIIDDDDCIKLSSFGWYGKRSRSKYYAVCNSFGKQIRMHRVIMNPPENMVVDHINGNTLDNRKKNLRICTIRENTLMAKKSYQDNQIRRVGGGIRWQKKFESWMVQLNLGMFTTEEEAMKVFTEMSIALEKLLEQK